MTSVWSGSVEQQPRPALAGDIKTDVLVISCDMNFCLFPISWNK